MARTGDFSSVLRAKEPRLLDTFTMRPAAALRIKGRNVCVTITGPKNLTSYSSRNFSSGNSLGLMVTPKVAVTSLLMPALFTSTSSVSVSALIVLKAA